MQLLKNIAYLATCKDEGGQSAVHPIQKAALVWEKNKIKWVGKEKELPESFAFEKVYDAEHKMVIPGLIDCHTHLAFGGWRSDEFEMRLKGRSYLEIAKSGGGILSTVKATRASSEKELFEKSLRFLKEISKLGVTTLECKSGYGLSLQQELKLLRVYRKLSEEQKMKIIPTFMGAHTIPPEYKEKREEYIEKLIHEMIPAVAGEKQAEFCDVFVEDSAFTVAEARKILSAGKAVGLIPKLHADQLTSCGGAELAAELGAASADHLEKISAEGIRAMASTGVVGVMLPLAALYTREKPLDGRKLIDEGVQLAVATDFNPGSAPSFDLPLAMMLACNLRGLTPAEALKGATIYAAKALKSDKEIGSLEPGKMANFAVIDAPDPNFWLYHHRPNACTERFFQGKRMLDLE